MKKYGILFLILILLIFSGLPASADRLPNVSKTTNMQVPATTNLQLVGMMDSQTQVQINTRNYNSTDAEAQGFLSPGSTESNLVYKQDMMSNGGYLALAKDQTFDEGNQNKRGYNVDSASVSTYATDPDKGSKFSTSEQLTLTTTGNWSPVNETIHNALVQSIVGKYFGAFESSYDAMSDVSLTTGQLATIAQGRSTGYDDTVPAGVRYTLGIHPDMSTGLPYAQGSASTDFVVTNREGYQNTSNESATNSFTDSTSVNGLIFKFGKDFEATSGIEVGGS
ncbi:MAG: hypothetical protein LUQ50_05160 [Methanospirillum sp.]|uniref:hypothetical protein n=1 Tax=Methanospirillum sp. TaxID=45200 RepID=UPI00237322ED|nr:hypothetical protein [Methanospirillum sp.]MDD1728442.1 hypothetical protein [Methanospirillum sp.]